MGESQQPKTMLLICPGNFRKFHSIRLERSITEKQTRLLETLSTSFPAGNEKNQIISFQYQNDQIDG